MYVRITLSQEGLEVQPFELLVGASRLVFVGKPKFDKVKKLGKLIHFCVKSI
jgi:hypothetical protein